MITELTPEQEALISVYREKWRNVARSTRPIDRQKAAKAVKNVYTAIDKREPEIVFISSPHAVREILVQRSPQQLAQQLGAPLLNSLATQLSESLHTQIDEQLWLKLQSEFPNEQLALFMLSWQDPFAQNGEILGELWGEWQEGILRQMWEQQQADLRQQLLNFPGGEQFTQLGDFLWTEIGEPISKQLEETLWTPLSHQPLIQELEQQIKQPLLQLVGGLGFVTNIGRNMMASSMEMIDFCISVLNCTCDHRKWEALQALVGECSWFIQLENACLVCDRPLILSFDPEHHLHAEGEPAIEFADGYRLYAYRGVRLPERYGVFHPNQWQSRWLLEENNAELRRVLIQGIGYSRICQELQAIELDHWREYTLLRIENEVDIEPIHLLKMTCPSTGYIHATRVPPDLQSAREAIRWVNWGTDPAEFSVET